MKGHGRASGFFLAVSALCLAVILYTGGSAAMPASQSAFLVHAPALQSPGDENAANLQPEGPDITEQPPESVTVAVFQGGSITVHYDLSTGEADFHWRDRKVIRSFHSAVKLPELLTSKDYTSRTVLQRDNLLTVISSRDSYPTMKQHFLLLDDDSLSITVEVEGSGLSSNYMAPLVMNAKGGVDIGEYADVRALWVPFDNDRDVKFDASTIHTEDTSYEVAAFYDNASRNGLVIGSVAHDTWKTGIFYRGSENKLNHLEVFGGVSIRNDKHEGTMIRDVQQHGPITGDRLISPEIFVGFFLDWRDGMEAYADANAARVPMRPWLSGVPFGWNSWGAVGSSLDTQKALAASDFMEDLRVRGFSDNDTVYINLDSYWDNAAMDLDRFMKTVRERGQKAGIYWGPFVDWIKDPGRLAEGTPYTYKELWLKDDSGNPVTYRGSAYALDPTHPGTRERIDFYMDFFSSKGFDAYIKLDFLTHAALEGNHWDPSVTTGIQAFHKGMTYLTEAILNKMGPNTFISQAISPLFPYPYAHARRISCDKFGYLFESKDVLNASAYGWWMSGRLYAFNDPDHLVISGTWWNPDARITENEAKTRVTSAVVSGAPLLAGDDFTHSEARSRAMQFLTHSRINDLIRAGSVFRPVEGNTGTSSPELFVLDNGDGSWYLALFNWDAEKPAPIIIDLERAGLDPEKSYRAVDQWTGDGLQVAGEMSIRLEPAEAGLYLLY